MKTKKMNKLVSYPLIFHESNVNIVTISISSKSVTCFYCIPVALCTNQLAAAL